MLVELNVMPITGCGLVAVVCDVRFIRLPIAVVDLIAHLITSAVG